MIFKPLNGVGLEHAAECMQRIANDGCMNFCEYYGTPGPKW